MAWFVYREMPLHRHPHQPHIPYKVEQLVSGWFIGIIWVGSIQHSVMHPKL